MNVIEDANLTRSEMYRLFQIAMSAIPGARHDLRGALNVILVSTQIAKRHTPDQDEFSSVMTRIETAAMDAFQIVEASLTFRQPRHEKIDSFVAQPAVIVQLVGSVCPKVRVTIEKSDVGPLSLIFPASALFIMLHELVVNAARHSGDFAEVLVSWQIRDQRFVCTVDDNGPGMRGLTDSYLPVDALEINARGHSGLFLVLDVLDSSGGLLLFRRSATLKGTQVLVEFPVVGYFVGDKLTRFADVYEN